MKKKILEISLILIMCAFFIFPFDLIQFHKDIEFLTQENHIEFKEQVDNLEEGVNACKERTNKFSDGVDKLSKDIEELNKFADELKKKIEKYKREQYN